MAVAEVRTRGRSFAGAKFYREDFSKYKDLAHANFRGATLLECSFRGVDLSYADFEGADCHGSDFTDAILRRTNFRDCPLASTIFNPADAMGMTLTLDCSTFDGMKISRLWLICYLMYVTLMDPQDDEKLKDKLIAHVIGPERWLKFKAKFDNRSL